MAIAGFVMVACSSARLSIRCSLAPFEVLKLNLISASLLMANVLMERGWISTAQAGVTRSPIKTKNRSQEKMKV